MPNQSDLIEKAIAELFVREKAYSQFLKDEAEQEHQYRKSRAVAYLEAEGTVADKNAVADLQCADLYQKKVEAEARVAASKAMLDDCRQVLSARQSILSAHSKTSLAMDLHAMKNT